MGRRWRTDPTLRPGTARSVVRNGFRIGGVESAGLIELEEALRRRPSGRQWRGLGREIEIGENGAYGNGTRNEGDDAHRSTAGRADERQDIIEMRAMRAAHLEEVRRPGAAADEPAAHRAPSCPEGDSSTLPCSCPSAMT